MSATILIVGDHDFTRRALRGWLEITFPGCHVVEATDEQETIARAGASSPRVVVVDNGLRGMAGFKITAHLKALMPAIPIVVLTSYDSDAQYAHALASGASACVLMDRIAELQSTLAELLPPHTNPLDTSLVDGDNAMLITG
jgi:CheY-like chemotaxis protein